MKGAFEYDLWATLQWLAWLQERGTPEVESAVLRHLLGAQEVWLARCSGVQLTSFPVPELSEETARRLSKGWIDVVEAGDDRVIDYQRFNGEPHRHRLFHIARHVLNHGTYHRGELRGICRMRGDDDFPETDLIRFDYLDQ